MKFWMILSIAAIPDYVASLKSRKVKLFRHYHLHTRRELCEFDICILHPANGYRYCLVVCDAFTRFIWVGLLKSKKKTEVLKTLKQLIEKTGKFSRSISDSELRYTSEFWHKQQTYYHNLGIDQCPEFYHF